jgi:hypothetical protein
METIFDLRRRRLDATRQITSIDAELQDYPRPCFSRWIALRNARQAAWVELRQAERQLLARLRRRIASLTASDEGDRV